MLLSLTGGKKPEPIPTLRAAGHKAEPGGAVGHPDAGGDLAATAACDGGLLEAVLGLGIEVGLPAPLHERGLVGLPYRFGLPRLQAHGQPLPPWWPDQQVA